MLDRFWNQIDRPARVDLARKCLACLDSADYPIVVGELSLALRTRASTLLRKQPDALATDIARCFTLFARSRRHKLFNGYFVVGSERAILFNALLRVDPEKQPEPGVNLEFGVADLEPYRVQYGEMELKLALAYVAESGRVDCMKSAGAAFERLAYPASRSQAPTSSMQENALGPAAPRLEAALAIATAAPVQNAGAIQAEPSEVDLSEWLASPSAPTVSAGEIDQVAVGGPANSEVTDVEAQVPTEISQDWSMPAMHDDEIDRVVLRAIVATANSEVGALSGESLRRMVEQLVRLNSSRFRSYLYLGFVDALSGKDALKQGGGINSHRRAWYLSGFHLGMRRMKSDAQFLDGVAAIAGSDLEVMGSQGAFGAAQKLLQPIVAAAIHESREALLADWLLLCGPFDRGAILDACIHAIKEAAPDAEANRRLLLACVSVVHRRRDMEGIVEHLEYEPSVILATLGCIRDSQGGRTFTEGLRQVRSVSWGGLPGSELCLACAMHDLALTSPAQLIPASDTMLEKAVRELGRFVERWRNAEQVGVVSNISHLLSVIEGSRGSSAALIESEVMEMVDAARIVRSLLPTLPSARFATYPKLQFEETFDILCAIAILVTPIQDRFSDAAQMLVEWLVAGNKLPASVLKAIFENMMLVESTALPNFFAECVRQHGSEFVTTKDIARAATLPEARQAREAILGILKDDRVRITAERRWEFALSLGRAAAAGGIDPELALECLDQLEAVVDREPKRYAEQFIRELDDPCWVNVALQEVRDGAAMRAAERAGRYDLIGENAANQLQIAMANDNLGLAEELLLTLDSHGLHGWSTAEQRAHLAAMQGREEAKRAPVKHRVVRKPVRILFVGGNEVQAAAEGQVLARLGETAPHVRVKFVRSGWTSNWNKYVDEVAREIEVHEAVVLITMVRTILGEKVRRLASDHDKPWIPCTGRGIDSVCRALVKAAEVVEGA